MGVDRHTRFEHCRVGRGIVAREFQIGLAEPFERGRRVGTSVVPGGRQQCLELLKTALGDAREEFVPVAEVTVRRRRADAGRARGLGEGEAGRSFLGDQVERCLQQRLFQVAVVVSAFAAAAIPISAPAHVKGYYINRMNRH
jgi:hypothetical protein